MGAADCLFMPSGLSGSLSSEQMGNSTHWPTSSEASYTFEPFLPFVFREKKTAAADNNTTTTKSKNNKVNITEGILRELEKKKKKKRKAYTEDRESDGFSFTNLGAILKLAQIAVKHGTGAGTVPYT